MPNTMRYYKCAKTTTTYLMAEYILNGKEPPCNVCVFHDKCKEQLKANPQYEYDDEECVTGIQLHFRQVRQALIKE